MQPAGNTPAPLTRREFLFYIWGASMAILTAESIGALVWFLIPRFRAGEFGGAFTIEIGEVPPPDSGPVDYPDGRFWLVNLSEQGANDPLTLPGYVTAPGVIAVHKVCVHLGRLYKWVPTNNRYECPCHGSKYLLNGVRIDGPARRSLDRFVIRAVDRGGNILGETNAGNADADPTAGLPILLPPGTTAIVVDTARRIAVERNPSCSSSSAGAARRPAIRIRSAGPARPERPAPSPGGESDGDPTPARWGRVRGATVAAERRSPLRLADCANATGQPVAAGGRLG